jgi:hypothetical protein
MEVSSTRGPAEHRPRGARPLIGSIRRECTDHLIVLNAEHLRRILAKYVTYYNGVRTHVSLGKDAPCGRPIEQSRVIVSYPILGGLHHRYARNLVFGSDRIQAAIAASSAYFKTHEAACH